MNTRALMVVLALVPLLWAGSCPPKIEEFRAVPASVCPGDRVVVRLVGDDLDGAGRITATPTPAAGSNVSIAGFDNAFVLEENYVICEPTTFDVKLWNGDEADCGEDETVCDRAFANLVVEPHLQTESRLPCDGFPGVAEFELTGISTLEVTAVTNCGSRTVAVACEDGEDSLAPGASTDEGSCLLGRALGGSWRAEQSLRGLEGCPRQGDLVPRPDPPAPPPICLRFEARCPDSDACS